MQSEYSCALSSSFSFVLEELHKVFITTIVTNGRASLAVQILSAEGSGISVHSTSNVARGKSGVWHLQTADCRPQTADRRLQAADCRLQAADCRLQTADCRLQTVDCRLQTTNCRLQTANSGPPNANSLGRPQLELSTRTWSGRAPKNRSKLVRQPRPSKRFFRIFFSIFELEGITKHCLVHYFCLFCIGIQCGYTSNFEDWKWFSRGLFMWGEGAQDSRQLFILFFSKHKSFSCQIIIFWK